MLEVVLVGGTEENAAGDVVAAASDDVGAVTAFGVVTAAPEIAEGVALQADLALVLGLVLFKYGAPEVGREMPPEEEAVIVSTGAQEIWLAALEAVVTAAAVEEVTTAVWLALIALL